ncbi:CHAP domain-containing protein [Apibacter adventoris]|uniref:CHAP domain-containing protein n=1 Tax=Apibacter adventoris TaxID=1679466 RepID=UPI000CF7377D|nr:CHAP domain-containing protein [Apibacter adventoris]PQL95929.1 hypothetical protein C4S76_00055 [Apibacter adventoris]
MQKIVFIALGYAETRFRLLGEDLSEYSSSKSIYKGRGFHQLTGIQDSSGLYNEAGPYEKYADFVGNKNIISQPDLLCTQIHYAIDSAGWFWTDKTNGKSVPNWSSASNTEYIKFRAEYFSKALGKQLNEVSHLVEEDEKYFWLQAKMLNGYPKGQKLETNPYGWTTRKKAFDILKNEVFEFDKRCKGNEELEFNEDGVLAKMKKIVDKHYTYKQETNKYRTEVSDEGLKYMDCSELVSRYLYELEVGVNKSKNEPIYMTTANMVNEKAFRKILGNENIDLVGKEESFKPQRGDIFAWGYSTGNSWNGHTGIVYKYDETKDLVTILEAVGSKGSADESQNTKANGGFSGKGQTRTAVFKRTSKALVNHKGWFGYYRPKNYTKKL